MEKLKEFAENKRVRMGAKPSLRDLSVLMKQAPQYQKELSRYSAHFSIAESCMTQFNKHVSQLCAVEQVPALSLVSSFSVSLSADCIQPVSTVHSSVGCNIATYLCAGCLYLCMGLSELKILHA